MKSKETVKKEKKVKHDGMYLRRPVVQIDMKTLQEVARFETAAAAQKQLHVQNVLRSIDRHGISGGYYWEFADLFKEGWQPTKRKHAPCRVVSEAPVSLPSESSERVTSKNREFLHSIPDEMILEEIRRRDNWHGTINYTTTITETF